MLLGPLIDVRLTITTSFFWHLPGPLRGEVTRSALGGGHPLSPLSRGDGPRPERGGRPDSTRRRIATRSSGIRGGGAVSTPRAPER